MPADKLPPSNRIHPSAQIDPSTKLGQGVVIGPGVIIGPNCVIGSGSRLGPRVVIVRDTTIGRSNDIHAGAILGDDPQERAFDPAQHAGQLIIGERNIIRECVTFHRGAGDAGPTRIGSDGFYMACSHVGHNCVVGDGVILTNYAALGGHVRVGDGCVLSAHTAVHQFCDIGQYAMFQAGARVGQHIPPFTIVHYTVNRLAGVNVVGLRRSGRFTRADITELREVYRLLLRSGDPWPVKLQRVRQRTWRTASDQLITFVEEALAQKPPRARGICAGAARPVRIRRESP